MVLPVLHRDATGHHVEQSLEVILAAAHFLELVLVADAEFDNSVRKLAEFVITARIIEGDSLPFVHCLHAGDHAADGQADLVPVKPHGNDAQEQRDRWQNDPKPFKLHQPEHRSHTGKKQQRSHGDGLHHETIGSEPASHHRTLRGSGGSLKNRRKGTAYSPSMA